MKIVKRDGRIVQFDRERIASAIRKAMADTDAGVDDDLARKVSDQIADSWEQKDGMPTVEQIQDEVECALMSTDRQDAAKKFILYRAERTRQRNLRNDVIRQVITKTNAGFVENANANVDERTFGGRKNEAATVLQKSIALTYNMDPEVSRAHQEGLIYQHDLDHFNVGAHNCLFIDFEHLFKNGFKTRNCDVRPPTSFSTACQLVAVAMQLQSQCQFG